MVNTREIAAEYRLTHWAQILQDRADSGLTVKAYCTQQGICGNTYFYWQRKVRAAAAELAGCVCEQPPVSFRQVVVAKPAAYPEVAEVKAPGQLLLDAGGVHLAADSAYPVEKLAQLLQTLRSLC